MSRRWLATGVVESPVDAVFAALLAVGPVPSPDNDAGVDSDGILRYEALVGEPAYTIAVEVDRNRHTLAMQGHWWYRGVHAVRECPRGSLVEYRVHNIAARGGWTVPLMQWRLPRQMHRDLAALLQAIGRHLDCPAYLDPEG